MEIAPTTTTYDRPVFKPQYRAVPQLDGLVLLSSAPALIFDEPHFGTVARLLDGRPLSAIEADLPEGLSLEAFHAALATLQASRLLTEAEDAAGLPDEAAAWWSGQHVSPAQAQERLAETAVTVDSIGGVAADAFAAALQGAGVQVAPDTRYRVVLVDDYLNPELEAYNEARLDDETPWLLVKPEGDTLWVGPLMRPWDTSCWACMAQRLRINRPVESFLQDRVDGVNAYRATTDEAPLPRVTLSKAQTAASYQAGLHLAAHQLAEWIGRGDRATLENTLVTFDLRSLETQRHHVVHRPQCPACGVSLSGEEYPAHPVVLEPRPKHFTRDGGHRTVDPETTVKRYDYHVSPLTGAVNKLQKGRSSDKGLHFYQAGRNTAFYWNTLKDLKGGVRSQSSGKGATDIQARASALCESLERYSAVFRGEEPITRAVMQELGDRAIHPNDCMHYSARQYAERDAWNAMDSKFNRVPAPFDPSLEIDWSPAWSMTRQEHRYLPTSFAYFGYRSFAGTPTFCHACSNGNAAGNTLEEAILQGFFELVERDSVGLWWYPRIQKPAVDLDSFADPYINQMRAYLHENGRTLWALDLRTDLGIPAFVVLSALAENGGQLLMGFGAHLDARIALLRAVTEMVQLSARFLDFGVDVFDAKSNGKPGGSEVDRWMAEATLENQLHFVPNPAVSAVTAQDFERTWSDDITEDVLHCQRVVEGRGYEMLVLDQTRPDIKLPCVKVIVPGLRHFWSRFAPGRLYDVPVEMGWVSQPVPEEDLNPIPMFL